MPVPFGEIALLLGQPHQTVLPLLWLRQERRRAALFDGPRRHDLHRGGARPGPAVRHADPRRRCLAPGPRPRRRAKAKTGHPDRRAGAGLHRLQKTPARLAPRYRLFQGPRPVGRNRQAIRPGLCAGRLAQPGGGVPALRRPTAGRERPGHHQRRRPRKALRPFPRPGDVPDPQRQGRMHRLRGPGAGRRQTQIPQFPRNPRVQQRPRALWPV